MRNYNYYRDYDPSLGRYVQSDPIGLEGGLNTYGYALQNPLSNTDFFGLSATSGNCTVFCVGIIGHWGSICYTVVKDCNGERETTNVELVYWHDRPFAFIGMFSCERFNFLKGLGPTNFGPPSDPDSPPDA